MWKVLLVEDEVFVRESVREIIAWEELGFTVTGEAGNGAEALDMIRLDPPDLVLADIVMPEMDGVELLRRTREEGYGSKFIMLTCMSDFEYMRQAMEYGASNYILKLSMSVNSLRDTLRKLSSELIKDEEQQVMTRSKGVGKQEEMTSIVLQTVEPEAITSHPEVLKILHYIQQHYNRDITVKFMSQYVMMGENYVSALFKKKTGQTLIHYLHQVRVEKAKHYLIHTELPVHEIGHQVGFLNDNYFIKIFKRLTQHTPSKYRQLNKSAQSNKSMQ
ncbi:response regulator [Paenibacillus lentus]|uniref:response regulator n=1 Tax=Paenibacillus lentus TaxID=1338368 RepID=UPI0036593234